MKFIGSAACCKCRELKKYLTSDIQYIDVETMTETEVSALNVRSLPILVDDENKTHELQMVSVKQFKKMIGAEE